MRLCLIPPAGPSRSTPGPQVATIRRQLAAERWNSVRGPCARKCERPSSQQARRSDATPGHTSARASPARDPRPRERTRCRPLKKALAKSERSAAGWRRPPPAGRAFPIGIPRRRERTEAAETGL
eukprot:scaffold57_cov254-Pinguiococcus_pyrenoidosus.AAC.47